MSEYVSEKESLLRRSPNKIIDAKNISKKSRQNIKWKVAMIQFII